MEFLSHEEAVYKQLINNVYENPGYTWLECVYDPTHLLVKYVILTLTKWAPIACVTLAESQPI